MKRKKQLFEGAVHGIFLLLGLITVGCVLLITVYLVISGIPAIRKIGLVPFLFGKIWKSTGADPSYGILPFILTSVYGTAGAIVLGVPVGFLTAVYLAKAAPPRIKAVLSAAVSLLAGIPSIIYGLVGMLCFCEVLGLQTSLIAGARGRAGGAADGRADKCPRPDLHVEDRGARHAAQGALYHRHRHPQYAAGRAYLRSDGVFPAG